MGYGGQQRTLHIIIFGRMGDAASKIAVPLSRFFEAPDTRELSALRCQFCAALTSDLIFNSGTRCRAAARRSTIPNACHAMEWVHADSPLPLALVLAVARGRPGRG